MKKILFLSVLLLSSHLSFADEKKKSSFEWGVGLFAFSLPHYRGSDQSKNYFWPVPHFVYKNEFIEAEPSIVTGTFFENNWFAIKLSLLAGLAVESEENKAREGMPDLDYTVEAGPRLLFKLWKSNNGLHELNFHIPIRQVVATDFSSLQNAGFFSVPFLSWIAKPQKYTLKWRSDLSIAGMFATRRNHDYYYSVAPEFVRSGRPQFAARGGYSGTQITWIANRRYGNINLVGFVRYDILEGVAFEDSPLFKKGHYTVLGLNTTWIF